ncbi:MAG: hypothetical protein K6B65_02240 [Bacilli bacterium]|nr:hypothetical protein [Bacilli bacterium]
MKAKKEYPQSNLKVLGVVYELSLCSLAPSKEGIEVVLHGEFDYGSFSNLILFGSLLSIQGKRLAAILRYLVIKGQLREKEVKSQGEIYYFLTEEGERMAKAFLSHYHKSSLVESKPEKRKFLDLDSLRED